MSTQKIKKIMHNRATPGWRYRARQAEQLLGLFTGSELERRAGCTTMYWPFECADSAADAVLTAVATDLGVSIPEI